MKLRHPLRCIWPCRAHRYKALPPPGLSATLSNTVLLVTTSQIHYFPRLPDRSSLGTVNFIWFKQAYQVLLRFWHLLFPPRFHHVQNIPSAETDHQGESSIDLVYIYRRLVLETNALRYSTKNRPFFSYFGVSRRYVLLTRRLGRTL